MKKNITQCQFGSIVGWRGDSLCCPQAFGGDCYAGCSMGCWWCFCREMEEELYTKYYTGWTRDLVRPCAVDDFRKLFDRIHDRPRPNDDWTVKCLRRGLPFNMGSKAETFCREDLDHRVVEKVLELFIQYQVPAIFETKSHLIGMQRYSDLIRRMKCAVIVAIGGGTDTLNYVLEPGAPPPSSRWQLVKELNRLGIWSAVRWEPIMPGINSGEEVFDAYCQQAVKSGAKHISWYNYRTSSATIAMREFESRGFDYPRMLERNLDENWRKVGRQFVDVARKYPSLKISSPDFVNFPFDSDCESCCGVDGLFTPYEFTFQHAVRIIRDRGQVTWDDMDAIDFREPDSYIRMKEAWNGGGGVYSLADSPEVKPLDYDRHGKRIYGRAEPEAERDNQGFGL